MAVYWLQVTKQRQRQNSGYKDGKYAVFWKSLDGSTPEEPLILRDDKNVDAWFFSPNGGTLLYAEYQFRNNKTSGRCRCTTASMHG